MKVENINQIFTPEILENLFPKDRSESFFDALYGDASEGAYDISLKFNGSSQGKLNFEFHLNEKPGKCLVCSVTYGLPEVFKRHPIINVKGVVQKIESLLNGRAKCSDWRLGRTMEASKKLHIIPLHITLEESF